MDEHAEGRTGGKKERKKEEGRKKERERETIQVGMGNRK